MSHSMKKEAAESRGRKLRAINAGGGPLAKESTNYATLGENMQAIDRQKVPTRKRGGKVEGAKGKKRLDRVARAAGGRVGKKGATNVNVFVAPQGGDTPKPVPVPVPVGGGAPAAPPPAPPMAAGPGAGGPPPGMMRPGMPPIPMRKRGGRIKRVKGGSVKVEAGAGSGLGRLAKTANVSKSASA